MTQRGAEHLPLGHCRALLLIFLDNLLKKGFCPPLPSELRVQGTISPFVLSEVPLPRLLRRSLIGHRAHRPMASVPL